MNSTSEPSSAPAPRPLVRYGNPCTATMSRTLAMCLLAHPRAASVLALPCQAALVASSEDSADVPAIASPAAAPSHSPGSPHSADAQEKALAESPPRAPSADAPP